MTERITCDASVLVAMLIDGGSDGDWAAGILGGASSLLAPHLAPFEAGNIIRRHQVAELISADTAAQAHADLLAIEIELWTYELLAARAWELRHNLSIYDASYVALAELTGTRLATLDTRIRRAPRVACEVALPPD